MAKSWWGKVISAFGFGPDDEEFDEDPLAALGGRAEEPKEEALIGEPWSERSQRRSNLVSFPGPGALPPSRQSNFKVLVVEPRSFEEVQTIADQLKGRRPIILNLVNLDKEIAQKILHFLNGVIYAIDGETQRVSQGIFFYAPQGVDISTLGRGLTGTAMGGGQEADLEALVRLMGEAEPAPREPDPRFDWRN